VLPRLGDEPELLVGKVGDRAHVVACVHDDLLPRERGVEVWDDADTPRVAERQRLRWRAVFTSRAERARVQLLLCGVLDSRPARTWSPCPARGDDHLSPAQRVDAELSAQLPSPLRSMNDLKMSIGAGKTIVVA
jgi:hypothetical protein